jgi:hypothetical protein
VRFLSAFLILCPLFLAGCRQDDVIQQETVTHEDREPIRLRVAILKHEGFAWFIRLDGPESLVNEHQKAFDEFVRSTKFTGKKDVPVTWNEPKEWKKDPPGGERYAGYRIPAKPKELEVKITRLPMNKEFGLMKNMHRWQKQVNRPLSESPEDNERYLKRDKIGDQEIEWVDMTGLGVHTVSKPPDPRDARQKEGLVGIDMNEGGRLPFKYAAPEGWEKKAPGMMAKDAYLIEDGKNSAEVTLTPLGGDPAANINRWREQVGLEKVDPDEIGKSAKLIQVAGIKSYYVDIGNPKGEPTKNRILGVIVPLNRRTSWFIKMTGPLDFVGQHKADFEKFVESFKK